MSYSPTASTVTASPSRLRSSALYEQVAQKLRARILAHKLAPGSWIDEQAIAAEYGISRTPLREALKVLASEGLVTMKLRRGAYVTEVSEHEFSEVVHLLALLESDAAADAATKADDTQMAGLAALHQKLEAAASNPQAFAQVTEQFHLRLLEIAGNQRRTQLVADLRRVMKLNRHHATLNEDLINTSLEELSQLMVSLKERNWARAKRLMQQHLAQQGRDASAPSSSS